MNLAKVMARGDLNAAHIPFGPDGLSGRRPSYPASASPSEKARLVGAILAAVVCAPVWAGPLEELAGAPAALASLAER